MAKILLNGEPTDVDDGTCLGGLLEASRYAGRRIAVEVNREIVPRSRYGQHLLREGDRVEIVQAMGGG
jgi:sulfur carrier protein